MAPGTVTRRAGHIPRPEYWQRDLPTFLKHRITGCDIRMRKGPCLFRSLSWRPLQRNIGWLKIREGQKPGRDHEFVFPMILSDDPGRQGRWTGGPARILSASRKSL
jgi:hypothetical protein